MQLSDGERRMKKFDKALRDVPNSQTFALATFHEYNPETMKVESGMTPEKELDYYKKMVDTFGRNIPYAIVMPKDSMESVGIKGEGEMFVVDPEGKLRWARVIDADKYDLKAAEIALRKFAAPAGG
jgi:hypothetical protein